MGSEIFILAFLPLIFFFLQIRFDLKELLCFSTPIYILYQGQRPFIYDFMAMQVENVFVNKNHY